MSPERQILSLFVVFAVIVQCKYVESIEATRINFGSCNHQDITDAVTWKSIISRDPDLWIWTGDVVYLDVDVTKSYPYSDYSVIEYIFTQYVLNNPPTTDISTWPNKYESMKEKLEYQYLKNNNLTTIIGVWDDHDFGRNNGDFSWKYKDYAQTLFLNFLEIPQNDSKRLQKGIYTFYEMKNEININNMTYIKTIDIIMFDTRYFAKQDGKNDILGNDQWEWFEDVIKNKLNGDLLIIVSSVQMMNKPPLYSREGWYKYDESQQKLFKLLKQYNKNDRLLLISGDVHRSEIMHSQCIGNDIYDFYEVTSSGITHAMYYESPYIEKFSYTLDDYTREDGVTGCKWLGRNFGEINIDWYYDENKNDVKIKNVSVEIRDENGNVKCMLDLPLFAHSDLNEYDDNSNYLWSNDFHTCYGAEWFHSKHDLHSTQAICGLSWIIMIMYPNVFFVMVCIIIIKKIGYCCCMRFDLCGNAKPKNDQDFDEEDGNNEEIHNKKPAISKKRSHAATPSLISPNSMYGTDKEPQTESFHCNPYYKTYGYVLFKNPYYFYVLITVIFVMGFKLAGPYNTEYPANIYILIVFGIIYCCSEMCLGFYCVYSFHIAKHLTITTCIISSICIIISFVGFKEVLINLNFVLADCISIVSSIFIISHGFMHKSYIIIIAFQIIIAIHKIYSLGSHLLYIHNEVPDHSAVGWFWIIQICLIKIYLSQFIFRSKLQYMTDILYDNLLIQRKKYKKFEILFPILLIFVFGICSFYMATNTNDWNEGYVSVGTFLEFSFMFNWPSTIFLFLWLCFKKIKIPKKHQAIRKQLTFTLRMHGNIEPVNNTLPSPEANNNNTTKSGEQEIETNDDIEETVDNASQKGTGTEIFEMGIFLHNRYESTEL